MTKRLVGLVFVGLLISQHIVIGAAIEIWALGLEHDIPGCLASTALHPLPLVHG